MVKNKIKQQLIYFDTTKCIFIFQRKKNVFSHKVYGKISIICHNHIFIQKR